MKVAIGSFYTETHSFSTDLTDLEAFKQCIWDDADHLIENHKNTRGDGGGGNLGGFVDYAETKGWDIFPLFAAGAWPAGPIPKSDYEYIKGLFRKRLTGLKADGILFHLHGAAVVQDVADAEGDFLTFVRGIVGDDIPIMVVHDQHANVSELMCEKCNAIFGYDTYPHMDVYERQQEACELFEKIVAKKVKPVMFRTQPPLLLPAILTSTNTSHMKKLMTRAQEWEKKDEVINVSVFTGYYGSDKYETGASCITITDDNPKLAEEVSKDIADLFWELKDEFMLKMIPIDEAIKTVKENEGTWALMDECDDPLGGGASDGTYILQRLINAGIESGGVSVIKDPEIVQKSWKVGVGGQVKGKLGGKTDNCHGEPIDINATVLKLTDQEIPLQFLDDSTKQNVGKIAVIEERGIKIVVVELKGGFEGIDIFGILGYDIRDMKCLVLKGSSAGYKEVFRDIPAGYLIVESLGITNPDVRKIGEFKNIRRPIYPLDENVTMRYK